MPIVLAAAEGRYNKEIAAALGCATVAKWLRPFAERRLDGLSDDPRPGPPRRRRRRSMEVIVRPPEQPRKPGPAVGYILDDRGAAVVSCVDQGNHMRRYAQRRLFV